MFKFIKKKKLYKAGGMLYELTRFFFLLRRRPLFVHRRSMSNEAFVIGEIEGSELGTRVYQERLDMGKCDRYVASGLDIEYEGECASA